MKRRGRLLNSMNLCAFGLTALAFIAASLLAAQVQADGAEPSRYIATLRRTSFGIAHIEADDLPSAAYAQAYAAAQDHVCVLADQFLKLRSERSKYFGRGESGENLASDFGYLAFDVRGRARESAAQQDDESLAIARGFVAGYNSYLRDYAGRLPAPCSAAAWVNPIDEEDFFARVVDLTWIGPARALLGAASSAQPPSASGHAAPSGKLSKLATHRGSSNGWAIGGSRTENGRGALLANPHFPWSGELRFHELHITVPGQLNVYGVSLLGVPGVMIGFNEYLSWMTPFSASLQAAVYSLELDPSDPTRYVFDGEVRDMLQRSVRVEVAGEEPAVQTLYATAEHGPIVSLPGVGWSAGLATAIASANSDSYQVLRQFRRMNQASNLSEFKAALAEERALPWVNVVYADREGNAYYADASRVPDLSEDTLAELAVRLRVDPFTQQLWQSALVLLDGASPRTSFKDSHGRSRIVPFERAPQILRSDFVHNSNGAYPFTHPEAEFGDHSVLYLGTQAIPRPRTRLGLQLLSDTGSEAASGSDARWSRHEIETVALRGDAMLANQLRDPVLWRCQSAAERGAVVVDDQAVDLGPACAALSGWDRRVNLDSSGAALWREFLSEFGEAALIDRGPVFAVGADPSDPIGTPRDLTPAPSDAADPIAVALARGVLRLRSVGIEPPTPLGAVQFLWNGFAIAVPGAPDFEGSLNVTERNPDWLDTSLVSSRIPFPPIASRPEQLPTGLTAAGYVFDYGNTFLMAVEFSDEGPRADAIMVYGQAADPASPHYYDQTHLYLKKQWRPVLFREHEIVADPQLEELYLDSASDRMW
jgi:acyl-homoserine-lactone acylase